MRKIDSKTALMLPPGRLVSVLAELDICLSMECGLAWITVEGDEEDYWLTAGASLHLPARRRIVIEAERDMVRLELTPLTIATPLAPAVSLAPILLMEEI